MNLSAIRDEIKLKLTGELLELELEDETIDKIVYSSLREVQRYINCTKLKTVDFKPCIDLNEVTDEDTGKPLNVNTVISVYRQSATGSTSNDNYTSISDPYTIAQWQVLAGPGNLYNYNDYVLNFLSYNTLNQIRNTTSTDMAFVFNETQNKLYINSLDKPSKVTIEYIPRFNSVEELKSDYWIDVLVRLSVATTKVITGRIRSRYTQSNALWSQDGAEILAEGQKELETVRQEMLDNSELSFLID